MSLRPANEERPVQLCGDTVSSLGINCLADSSEVVSGMGVDFYWMFRMSLVGIPEN